MIVPLSEVNYGESNLFGGKANMLSLMINNGINAPNGIAVSADVFFSVLNDSPIQKKFEQFWKTEGYDEDVAKLATDYIMSVDVSRHTNALMGMVLERFSMDDELICRSSATSEDGNEASYAGQFVSPVGNYNQLEKTIKRVWCSVFAKNVKVYFDRKKHKNEIIGMGIVIQKLLHFDYSGVLFSRHPTMQIKDWIFMEFVQGALEKLVNGEVTPQKARINIANSHVLYENSGIRLPDAQVSTLISHVKKLKSILNADIDIECGIYEDKVVFLQCRPITT